MRGLLRFEDTPGTRLGGCCEGKLELLANGAVGSPREAWGSRSNLELRSAEEIPTQAPGLSQQPLASLGRSPNEGNPNLKRVRAVEYAGVCPSWAQIWAQIHWGEILTTRNCLKLVVGRDGIEPPTPGFSVLDHDARKSAEMLPV